MSIDRDAALKRAEKLLRQGKLDGAIEEYVRLVEEQPKDWNSINALGDLYVRAGDSERAVARFTHVADYLYGEGFLPKAAALYKKALKVRADHEPTIQRLVDIAVQQGLLADAKHFLRLLARLRRERGDARAAAESLVQLAGLDPDDAEALISGAGAAADVGDVDRAAAFFKQAAAAFAKHHRLTEALDARACAARLDPADEALRAQLAQEYVDAGQHDRAREFLTRESAGDNPELLLALARAELAAGNEADGRALLTRVVMIAPDRHGDIMAIADGLVADGRVDSAYGCVEVVCDAALLGGDLETAISALQQFVRGQAHVAALSRLVEVAVDAGRDDVLHAAQAALADAYLEAGRAQEARVIAEDLIAQEPAANAHRNLLRRALEALGVANIDEILAGSLGAGSLLPESLDLSDLGSPEVDAGAAVTIVDVAGVDAAAVEAAPEEIAWLPVLHEQPAESPLPDAADDGRIMLESFEIDLTEIVAGIRPSPAAPPPATLPATAAQALPQAAAPAPPAAPPDPPAEPAPQAPPDLEAVFSQMRARASRDEQASGARAQYDSGLAHLTAGRLQEAILDLQAAARVPSLRFQAAAALGRIHLSRGELHPGVEWLERAAEAPASSPAEGHAILYELADALERMGEQARSLAILIELDTDAANYRDVRARISALTRA